MEENQLHQVVAYADFSQDSLLAVQRAIQLGAQLDIPVRIKGYLAMPEQVNELTAEKIGDWFTQLEQEEALFTEALKVASKKNVESHASIEPHYDPAKETFDDHDIIMLDLDEKWFCKGQTPTSILFLLFSDSRKYLNLNNALFVCDSDMTDSQLARFSQLCAILKKAESTINVVFIEGQGNITKWQEHFSSGGLDHITIEFLREYSDLNKYIKSAKPKVICLPNFEHQTLRHMASLHHLCKSDIIIF